MSARLAAATTSALVLALAASATAQQSEVTREVFTYALASTITVDVLVDVPGTLRLMRGRAGRIEVTARAVGGFAGSGLAGTEGNELRLTAVGAERVDYLVVVPEEIRVRVRLPDRYVSEVFGTLRDVETYTWGPDAEPGGPGAPSVPVGSERRAAGEDGLYQAYASSVTPRAVAVAGGTGVRTVTVRWQGDRFRIATSRPLTLSPGDPASIEIRPSGAPLDLVVELPRATGEFVLRFGEAPALVVLDGRAITLCEPVIEQRLGAEANWFTFTPVDGRLECRGDGADTDRRAE